MDLHLIYILCSCLLSGNSLKTVISYPFGFCVSLLALFLMALGLQSCTPAPSEDSVAKTDDVKEEQLNLHVESPDWRDQIIYVLMIDRFNDDNPANNDQGYNEYNPNRESHYNGGDIPGITAKLDYMQRLGATSIWLTPPVANQWWRNASSYSGYHGY